MKRDVSDFILKCQNCQLAKSSGKGPEGLGRSPTISAVSGETVAIDLMDPNTRGSKGSTYLLVLVDTFTKWVELFPLRNCKAPGIISRLWEVFCRWGFPKFIASDNGSQFTSKLYLNFCTQNGLSPLHIAPYDISV
jgi:hypothetical protein